MVSLSATFIIFVIFFAFIGAVRGWAKETLVTFSMILGLFFFSLFNRSEPFALLFGELGPSTRFTAQAIYIAFFAVIGYAGPALSGIVKTRAARERLGDILLGCITGAINGYLIVGSMLYYLHEAQYPFEPYIRAPEDPLYIDLITKLAPALLKPSWLSGLVGLSLLIVLVVFV